LLTDFVHIIFAENICSNFTPLKQFCNINVNITVLIKIHHINENTSRLTGVPAFATALPCHFNKSLNKTAVYQIFCQQHHYAEIVKFGVFKTLMDFF
jgi:hypothetical protein